MRLYVRPLEGEPRWLGVEGDRFGEDHGSGEMVDTRAWWAIPGLADCHAHLAADHLTELDRPAVYAQAQQRAFAQLRGGVFVVVHKGWSDEVVLRLLDEPPDRRPELQAAGRIISGIGGYLPGFCVEVDPKDLPAAVAAAAPTGGWVKLIGDWPRKGRGAVANFPEEALRLAVATARGLGLRVAIHTMAPEVPGAAVRAGVDSIEHGLFLTEDDLAGLGERGGCWVPTVTAMRAVRDSLRPGSSGEALLTAGLDQVRRTLPLAAEAGVTVLAGSDLALAHGGIAAEAEVLAETGLGVVGAFEAVTTNAYRYLGLSRDFVPGVPADAVFLDSDPRVDLSTLRRPALVLWKGRVISPAQS